MVGTCSKCGVTMHQGHKCKDEYKLDSRNSLCFPSSMREQNFAKKVIIDDMGKVSPNVAFVLRSGAQPSGQRVDYIETLTEAKKFIDKEMSKAVEKTKPSPKSSHQHPDSEESEESSA
jgi:hypothetical protein